MSQDARLQAPLQAQDQPPSVAAPSVLTRPPRRKPATSVTEGGAIYDDARRSISVRINTSDYGRMKVASRRLGVRESELFRYLVRSGMSRLITVLEGKLREGSRYHLLVRIAADWRVEMGLTATECADLIGCLGEAEALELDESDLLLVDLAATRPSEAAALLGLQLGVAIDKAQVVARLGDHLAQKYAPST